MLVLPWVLAPCGFVVDATVSEKHAVSIFRAEVTQPTNKPTKRYLRFLFQTQQCVSYAGMWFNLARDDVLRMLRTPLLVTFSVDWTHNYITAVMVGTCMVTLTL